MLALPSLQALVPSSGHANPGAFFSARGLPCWRLASRKPLFLRRATPTPAPFFRRATFPVGALHLPSPCFSVGPRQQCALKSGARPSMLAPCTPQALVPPLGYANPGAFFPARVLLCWRLAPGKPLRLRQATPTPAPFSRRAAFHVGALYPASPCSFVGPRQQRRRIPGAGPPLLAPCFPQTLAPSSGHANRGAVIRARGLPCWRLAPRKPLCHRQATPTEAPLSERAAFHVGVLLPASPCAFVRPRQQRRRYPGARPSLLAPCSPQTLAPSSGHANRGAVIRARGLPCWRLAPRKPLRFRQATPTEAPLPRHAAFHVGALLPESPCFFVGSRQQGRRYPGTRPSMLTPCSPQALASLSDHANIGAVIRARGLTCWRLAPRKPLRLRQATPT